MPKSYLDDGAYVETDADPLSICLSAERPDGMHQVYLNPLAWIALKRFVAKVWPDIEVMTPSHEALTARGFQMLQPDITALVLRGRFTQDEFNELAALIRKFDESQPARTIELCAIDPTNSSLDVAEAMLRGAVPPEVGRISAFERWTRRP